MRAKLKTIYIIILKTSLEDLAKEWQGQFASYNWSYGELMEIGEYFNKNGKRYGLLREFKENGIC